MIVDSSAIIAILLDESEKPLFVERIVQGSPCSLSAASWVELAAVLTRRSDDRMASLYRLVDELEIGIADVDIVQARIGHDAYRRYGRGSGHAANLNFGDCFAYALSRATGEPLLFKGDDFIHTDVAAAA